TVDLARFYVGQQALQRRSFHVATGEAAIVIAFGQAGPALVSLAADESFGGLALGIQRVELLLQSFLGGLSSIDGAAHQGQRRRRFLVGMSHAVSLLWLSALRKKRNPLQWLPVTALATALSEG